MAKRLADAYAFDVHVREAAPDPLPAKGVELDGKEIAQGEIYNDGSARVSAFLVDHGTVKPAFGYRVDLQVALWSFQEIRNFARISSISRRAWIA
jgi:ribonuclease Z